MIRIGVLALQGSVIEHMQALSGIDGVEPVEVRTLAELNSVAGIIIPGGESTTLGKLIRDFDLMQPMTDKINEGMPVWGTCAGMILLAKQIVGEEYAHLGLMDIAVRRNAYGSQLDSFVTKARIPEVAKSEIPLVFIRAPWVEHTGEDAEVLLTIDEKIVAVRQKNIMATSFHPELTDDLSFHKYFVNQVEEYTRRG